MIRNASARDAKFIQWEAIYKGIRKKGSAIKMGMHHTDEKNNADKGTGIMTISSSAITPKVIFPGRNNDDTFSQPRIKPKTLMQLASHCQLMGPMTYGWIEWRVLAIMGNWLSLFHRDQEIKIGFSLIGQALLSLSQYHNMHGRELAVTREWLIDDFRWSFNQSTLFYSALLQLWGNSG